jgi:hypothetical protein
MVTTIKVPDRPPIEVALDPEESWDAKGRRALVKELRAAGWEGRRVIWAAAGPAKSKGAAPPLAAFGLAAPAPALDLLYRARIGLTHLLYSLRMRFPGIQLRLTVSGNDGRLVLRWPLAVPAGSIADSLVGHVPASDQPARGPDWWREHDGGTRFLAAGDWVWDEAQRAWRASALDSN